jgi:hypothetical protein
MSGRVRLVHNARAPELEEHREGDSDGVPPSSPARPRVARSAPGPRRGLVDARAMPRVDDVADARAMPQVDDVADARGAS